MKEIRFFYAPDVAVDAELPVDESDRRERNVL